MFVEKRKREEKSEASESDLESDLEVKKKSKRPKSSARADFRNRLASHWASKLSKLKSWKDDHGLSWDNFTTQVGFTKKDWYMCVLY